MKPCPIQTMPVYVKAGSIVPFGPAVQYSNEKPWDNLEIRIYPGADGSFTLFEDEGDGYNYEKGAYSTINFRWNEVKRTLTIGDCKGFYKGMLQRRKFNIVLVGEGMESGDRFVLGRSIDYSGKMIQIVL